MDTLAGAVYGRVHNLCIRKTFPGVKPATLVRRDAQGVEKDSWTACRSWDRHDVDESGGLADTERSGIFASLRVVDVADGRYRWAPDDPRWTERPDGAGPWDANGDAGPLGPDPQARPRLAAHVADEVGPEAEQGSPTAAGPPVHLPVRTGFGLIAHDAEIGTMGPARVPRRERSADRDARLRRRRRSDEDEFRRTSRAEIFGEEPRYSALFGLTAAWYALPTMAYLLWLLVGGGGRLGSVAAQTASSLPWLGASLLLSFAVAGLLRWAMVGWRALTLSFAAAVIGAGVATIAHTFAA